jgi:ESS family glutamate:Na+ symporter
MGFSGGHGTAAVLGSFLRGLGLPYWEIAQGVCTTTATVGLVGSMIIGIFYINIMARRGKTALLKKPGDIPAEMSKGIQMDVSKQASLGKETTYNSSIESMSFHLSIVFLACGIAYLLMRFFKANNVPVITHIPIWAYAIVVMFGVNFLIQKFGLGNLVDSKAKSRITGTFSDFAIAAAIASMPLKAILTYLAPILFMCVLGLIFSMLVIILTTKYFFSDYHVERSMAIWGASTGVFLTGLMLLKICDSDYELPVLNDYSIGFSLTSISGFIMMPLLVNMMLNAGIMPTLFFQIAVFMTVFIVLSILKKMSKTSVAV